MTRRNYKQHSKYLYLQKKIKQSQYAKNINFISKNNIIYTLEDINNYNEKIKSSIIENEINSIHRALDKKISIFKTTTIKSNYNLSTNQSSKDIDRQLKV